MTESERNEFERQRILAEQRMRDMYSVEGSRLPKPPNTPPMPPFLRPTENRPSSRPQPPPDFSVNSHNQSNQHNQNNSHNNNNQHNHNKLHVPSKAHENKGFDLLSLLNFKNFELDNDRVLIIAMALLLSTEKMDEMLMLALLYIML